jgi:hypothetical protein
MGWFKNMLRNYLEIKEPQSLSVNIEQMTDAEGQMFINKIWYRGIAGELEQLYEQLSEDNVGNNHFWGSKPTGSMKNMRKIHTGLPALIVDTLANISTDDLDKIDVKKRQEEWETIAKENNFKELIKEAVQNALYSGDGAFKWSIDTEISEYPIIEFYEADRVDFVYKRSRIVAIVFKTKKIINKQDYMLHEIYKKEGITYKLFDKEGKERKIEDFPELANECKPVVNNAGFMMALPFKIYKSQKCKGRGKSIFDGKLDNFDAFDEVFSQWMLAVRKGQIKEYIPDNLLPRDPKTGLVLGRNDFDNDFIQVGADMGENSKNEIKTSQGEIQAQALLTTYITVLDLCLQGLISPSTLGIDTKKLDNAEAQREKEKTTLYRRNQIIKVLDEKVKEIVNITFKVYDNMKNTAPTETESTVTFGGYANPSFEAQVETVGKASTTNVMSVETQVEELWGDTKDDAWKAKEVKRIKQEKGIEVLDEPAVNQDIELIENQNVLNGKER